MSAAATGLELRGPRTLDEALRMLRDEGPLVPLAGCTDVFVGLHFGTEPARRFMDLWGLDELRGIAAADGVLRLGTLTTYTEMVRSEAVREWLPALAAAAREVGGAQIQNRGTLGGNVANGSPAADTLPVLAAADASVVLRSLDGERRVPVTGLYTGYRATVIRPDELIVALEVPRVEGRQWFRKVGTRAAQAISKVVMAGIRGPEPRIAFGSVAATVVRAPETERCLASGGSVDEAERLLRTELHPIDDVRSTAAYRLQVAANLLRQWWEETA
ncbi:MAG TPA: FAD binding domain-containing protein [Longimicrobiaceae bacterium]|nr:FAD binding domain-containing protein [Longimicrobiaceae bacterium]